MLCDDSYMQLFMCSIFSLTGVPNAPLIKAAVSVTVLRHTTVVCHKVCHGSLWRSFNGRAVTDFNPLQKHGVPCQ